MLSAPQKRFWANGRSRLTVSGVDLVAQARRAASLNFLVCIWHTGVSSDGTTLRIVGLPLRSASFSSFRPAFEVVQLEVGGLAADLHFLAGQRERGALERDGSGASHGEVLSCGECAMGGEQHRREFGGNLTLKYRLLTARPQGSTDASATQSLSTMAAISHRLRYSEGPPRAASGDAAAETCPTPPNARGSRSRTAVPTRPAARDGRSLRRRRPAKAAWHASTIARDRTGRRRDASATRTRRASPPARRRWPPSSSSTSCRPTRRNQYLALEKSPSRRCITPCQKTAGRRVDRPG